MTANRHHLLALAVACITPELMALKCVDYNPEFADTPLSASVQEAGVSDSVTPAMACPNPREAHITVENFNYTPACGCAETQGKTCTVSVGTKVIWTFADAESHNVTSVPNSFGKSTDKLAGSFSAVFDTPGEYPYGCTIHSEMRGFHVVAR